MGKTTDNDFVVLKRVEAQESKPTAVYPLPGGSQRVSFPNPFDMETEEYEKYVDEANRCAASGKFTSLLKFWLSEEDYEALVKAYPTPRSIRPVIEAVMAHYEADVAGLGN